MSDGMGDSASGRLFSAQKGFAPEPDEETEAADHAAAGVLVVLASILVMLSEGRLPSDAAIDELPKYWALLMRRVLARWQIGNRPLEDPQRHEQPPRG